MGRQSFLWFKTQAPEKSQGERGQAGRVLWGALGARGGRASHRARQLRAPERCPGNQRQAPWEAGSPPGPEVTSGQHPDPQACPLGTQEPWLV